MRCSAVLSFMDSDAFLVSRLYGSLVHFCAFHTTYFLLFFNGTMFSNWLVTQLKLTLTHPSVFCYSPKLCPRLILFGNGAAQLWPSSQGGLSVCPTLLIYPVLALQSRSTSSTPIFTHTDILISRKESQPDLVHSVRGWHPSNTVVCEGVVFVSVPGRN